MNKATAIIQARMGSTRLPGKSLKKIGDKTLIERVIDRIKLAKSIQQIVLATTDLAEDNVLANFVADTYPEVKIYRGSAFNVLDRFYQAAVAFDADPIVRVTADDPFKDPAIIDQLVEIFRANSYDYVSNTIVHTFPEGIDIEVFSLNALKKARTDGHDPKDKEHVTYYIWNNPDIFSLYNLVAKENFSEYRLTVDHPEDMELADRIYAKFHPRTNFSYLEIVELLKQNPDLSNINSHITKYASIKK